MGHRKNFIGTLSKEQNTAMEQVQQQADSYYEIPLHSLQAVAPDTSWVNPPLISASLLPTEVCQIIGEWYGRCSDETYRRDRGQFFTPTPIARYMASTIGKLDNSMQILDPGAGVGMLTSAICEQVLEQRISTIFIDAYEPDPILSILCLFTLTYTREFLQKHGIEATINVHKHDFVQAMAERLTQTSLWSEELQPSHSYDITILNPPYFKVNQKDFRARLVKDIAEGRTNMYTMFMSLAASTLRIGGRFVSITPRSFASGAYFQHFRRQFFNAIQPEIIHIFDSRRTAFEDDGVLQENIIIAGTKKTAISTDTSWITISQSKGISDLAHALLQQIPHHLILDNTQKDPVLHLPTSDIDLRLLHLFKHWHNYLATYELEISTGPVVPFRVTDGLTMIEHVGTGEAVPLLWLQHIQRMHITWPLEKFDKRQAVLRSADKNIFVKNTTQIIMRRFSAKEEARRITCAVLPSDMFNTDILGLENHLNYIYRIKGSLTYTEAVGLASFLNSSLVDRYFRIISGNTQVSATELRKLPLPLWPLLVRIGEEIIRTHVEDDFNEVERIIMEELKDNLALEDEESAQMPILRDSRMAMGKIQDAQRILRDLGLPTAQQNEISALTLLALCNLTETAKWSDVTSGTIKIHNMMSFMKLHYGRTYAENTREVVRRQVVHQFEQARIIDRNPDDPYRPSNSPNTCYALTSEARHVLAQYETPLWEEAVKTFIEIHGSLLEKYQQSRKAIALPLKLADGKQVYLTPGRHNELQIAIIEKFGPRYAADATVLYVGDAANKFLVYEKEELERLGIPITKHDKLPDVILYLQDKNWLYLIEAVTSHGPVTPKRKQELEKFLQHCPAAPVYVTAFLDTQDFRRHVLQIAWETEVWIADMPEHMIHYNGDKFMGPHPKSTT